MYRNIQEETWNCLQNVSIDTQIKSVIKYCVYKKSLLDKLYVLGGDAKSNKIETL